MHPRYNVAVAPRGSSFASVHGIKSYIESLGGLRGIVIRNFRCYKEMTMMTMFLGGQRERCVQMGHEGERNRS